MCNKIVWHSARNIGKTYKTRCGKPEYKDGLCAYHYSRQETKSKNWGTRDNYRACNADDMLKGRSMKLRQSNVHKLYKQRKGMIYAYNSKANKYLETHIPVDINLFVVKTL